MNDGIQERKTTKKNYCENCGLYENICGCEELSSCDYIQGIVLIIVAIAIISVISYFIAM